MTFKEISESHLQVLNCTNLNCSDLDCPNLNCPDLNCLRANARLLPKVLLDALLFRVFTQKTFLDGPSKQGRFLVDGSHQVFLRLDFCKVVILLLVSTLWPAMTGQQKPPNSWFVTMKKGQHVESTLQYITAMFDECRTFLPQSKGQVCSV